MPSHCQIKRLIGVERVGAPVADVAKRAAPRAFVAHDHEGRGAVAETLADIRARGFFAHRVQVVLTQDVFDLVEARGRRACFDPNPFGLLQRLRDGHRRDCKFLENFAGFGLAFFLGEIKSGHGGGGLNHAASLAGADR